jgi:glyoxylase-like metal-dependent hydrolase (beta-lactamase superfamily II)
MCHVQITQQLHFLRFPVGHVYLWESTDGLTLIDTGVPGSSAAIAEAIRELGHDLSDVRRLVLTHFHFDHAGAAAEITRWGDIEIIASRKDAPFLEGTEKKPYPDFLDWERPLFDMENLKCEAEPVRVTRRVDDSDVLPFDSARVVAMPGHTPGSMAVHLPEPNIVIVGDVVGRLPDGRIVTGFFNVDPRQAVLSFRKLASLKPSITCFGHGEPLIENTAVILDEAVAQLRELPLCPL